MNPKVMAHLIKLAPRVAHKFRLVAAVVDGGTIMALGSNSWKTSPFQKKWGRNEKAIYFHAETAALKDFLRRYSVDDLKDLDLYVVRVKLIDNSFVPALAKPCSGCTRAIEAFGLRNVYYTTDEKNTYGRDVM